MAKNPRFESNPIITEPYPEWIELLPPHYLNARFARLIQFYVFNSPCKVSSWGRMSMEDFGWINYWNSNRFRDLVFDSAELNSFNPCESATQLARDWPERDYYFESQEEYAYFVTAGEESPLMNLFHRIRNSISHGRFRINGSYFFFEDVDTDGRTVKARICLNIVTLENWMRIIKCECDTAKQLRDDMKKNRRK